MSIRCQARIVREYKTRKADSMPLTVLAPLNIDKAGNVTPADRWMPIDKERLAEYPETCGGEITLSIESYDEPDLVSDHYAIIRAVCTCSRCRFPYFDGIRELDDYDIATTLTRIVNEYYAKRQRRPTAPQASRRK